MQACFFEDGDRIVELDFWTPTYPVAIGDSGTQIFLPVDCKSLELDEADLENGMIYACHDESSEYVDCGLYWYDGTGFCENINDMVGWFRDNFDVSYVEKFSYTDEMTGEVHDGCYIEYLEVYEGETYWSAEYIMQYGNYFLGMDFYVLGTEIDLYNYAAISAMAGGLKGLGEINMTSFTVSVSEALPEFALDCAFEPYPVKGEGYDTIIYYQNIDPTAPMKGFGIYTWEPVADTLLVLAAQEDYPEEELMPRVITGWKDDDEIEYAYYTALNATGFADYTFVQAYFFRDGDRIIEVDYYTATEPIAIEGTALQMFVPVGGAEKELSEPDKANGTVHAHVFETDETAVYDLSLECIDFDIHVFDEPDTSIAEYMDQLAQSLDTVSSKEEYQYTSPMNGTTYDCAYCTYTSLYEGEEYIGEIYSVRYGDKIVSFDFYQLASEYEPYTAVSVDGMLYGIIGLRVEKT